MPVPGPWGLLSMRAQGMGVGGESKDAQVQGWHWGEWIVWERWLPLRWL